MMMMVTKNDDDEVVFLHNSKSNKWGQGFGGFRGEGEESAISTMIYFLCE